MNRHVELGPADRDASRPFAYLERNVDDVAALGVMAGRLRQSMVEHDEKAFLAQYQPNELHSPLGLRLRVVVTQPETLLSAQDLSLVGFFGHRRSVVPAEVIADKDTIDRELIAEFPQYPGVLAYCSMALNDADYGNLVLLAQPASSERWRTSPRHAFASRVIAPQYYATVRLQTGMLPGGLFSGQAPVLLRTKYYDFRDDWHWSAVREYRDP